MIMQTSKISIIIPVYKVEEYLDECMQTVINQTYKNLEIILVDDGSPDRCPQMCDSYAEQDSRIKVVHKNNGGLSDARNAGIDVATGDYIGFVDSDDYIAYNMYEELLTKIERSRADIISSKFLLYQDGKEQICTWSVLSGYIEGKVLSFKDYFVQVVDETVDSASWNKLYKKDIITEYFKKGRNNEDYLFFYQLVKKHPNARMVFTTDSYYKYRQQRSGSICADKTGLDLAVLANKKEILLDIDSWFPSLKEKIQLQRDKLLFAVIYNLTLDRKARSEFEREYVLLRKEFLKLPSHRIEANHIDVLILKYFPWLYSNFVDFRLKLSNHCK